MVIFTLNISAVKFWDTPAVGTLRVSLLHGDWHCQTEVKFSSSLLKVAYRSILLFLWNISHFFYIYKKIFKSVCTNIKGRLRQLVSVGATDKIIWVGLEPILSNSQPAQLKAKPPWAAVTVLCLRTETGRSQWWLHLLGSSEPHEVKNIVVHQKLQCLNSMHLFIKYLLTKYAQTCWYPVRKKSWPSWRSTWTAPLTAFASLGA